MAAWSEGFETGPDGASITTGNTQWEVVNGTFGGDAVFSSTQVKSGGLSAYRLGDNGSRSFATTAPAADFNSGNATIFSAWHYVTAGQAISAVPTADLIINSTASPTVQFVSLRHISLTEHDPGFKLSASAQSDVPLGIVPLDQWYRMQIEITPTQFIGSIIDEFGAVAVTATLVNNFTPTRDVAELAISLYHGYIDDVLVDGSPVRVAPPCRGYPRSDALSNSPRRYPPPKSRQYGNRANGYW